MTDPTPARTWHGPISDYPSIFMVLEVPEVAVTRPGLHTGRRPLLHPLACP